MPTRNQKVAVLFGNDYSRKLQSLFGQSIVSYLPLWEPAGATVAADIGGRGYNGAPTAVTFGAAGIGDGRTAASFDGSTSFVNWYSAGLNSAFNNAEGTLACWAKVSAAGNWTDGTVDFICAVETNGTNKIGLSKAAASNTLTIVYGAGATFNTISPTLSVTSWFHIAITWSKTGDAVKAYINGAQSGATQTGLGTWSGALAANAVDVGAHFSDASTPWSGLLAHPFLLNRAATAAEMLAAATVP